MPEDPTVTPATYTSVEICTGAGGQALGIERAGFQHLALVENDPVCCATLRAVRASHLGVSRPRRYAWKNVVREISVKEWFATDFSGKVSLFAGGVPCPPFSRAGRQLGADDDRDLFPAALRLIRECDPRGVLLENVRSIREPKFDSYREEVIEGPLRNLGFIPEWRTLEAKNFGVPQLRPRAILVALRERDHEQFSWPTEEDYVDPPTVGKALRREMARGGWPGAAQWANEARGIAPTLVGGSKKHGGPDLGPTQAKKQWEKLRVNGHLVATDPPGPDWNGDDPILTVTMAAILQGFPAKWPFQGAKTAAYRQVGNAFPPPVAEAVARKIAAAFEAVDDPATQVPEPDLAYS